MSRSTFFLFTRCRTRLNELSDLPRRIKSAVMKTIRPCVNFRIGDHHSLLGNYRAVQERNSRFRASDRLFGSYWLFNNSEVAHAA
jgi:hypothetical protein